MHQEEMVLQDSARHIAVEHTSSQIMASIPSSTRSSILTSLPSIPNLSLFAGRSAPLAMDITTMTKARHLLFTWRNSAVSSKAIALCLLWTTTVINSSSQLYFVESRLSRPQASTSTALTRLRMWESSKALAGLCSIERQHHQKARWKVFTHDPSTLTRKLYHE